MVGFKGLIQRADLVGLGDRFTKIHVKHLYFARFLGRIAALLPYNCREWRSQTGGDLAALRLNSRVHHSAAWVHPH